MKLRILLLVISLCLIIIGLSIHIKYNNYFIRKNDLKDIQNYIEHKSSSNYFALLEIPRIQLKQGIIKNQNVDKGIEILNYDSIPNNIILAAHSGNCSVCYFNYLDRLKIGDEIKFYYNNRIYIYDVINIDIKHKKSFSIDNLLNTITLITCKKDSKNLQIVVTGKLKISKFF